MQSTRPCDQPGARAARANVSLDLHVARALSQCFRISQAAGRFHSVGLVATLFRRLGGQRVLRRLLDPHSDPQPYGCMTPVATPCGESKQQPYGGGSSQPPSCATSTKRSVLPRNVASKNLRYE